MDAESMPASPLSCYGIPGSGNVRDLIVEPEDTLRSVLGRLALRDADARRATKALRPWLGGLPLDVGESVRVRLGSRGRIDWVRYRDDAREYCAERTSKGTFTPFVRDLDETVDVDLVAGNVQASLFDGMDAVNERPALGLMLAELFAARPELLASVDPTDTFRVLVEKRRRGGEFRHYGQILAAQYNRRSKPIFRTFFFEGRIGQSGYYDEDGRPLPERDLQSPIRLSVITSGYGMRRHPILGYTRQHRGVDYAAPRGTPVVTVLNGVIVFQRMDEAFGRLIEIDHGGGLVTRYAHLERFVRGLRDGDRVTAGDVIGYVGQSGLATGAHLHFETVREDAHVDPLTVSTPAAPVLDGADLARFHATSSDLLGLLDPSSALFAVVPRQSPGS